VQNCREAQNSADTKPATSSIVKWNEYRDAQKWSIRASIPDLIGIGSLGMNSLIQWFTAADNALAVLVTIGVAVLLVCCLECSDCRHREEDDIFRHHQV